MKVGIVVPFSWSFWGGVVEHAELQADALRGLGCDVKTIMGNDPPGQFTRVLHPRHGRHGMPPPDVIPIGRSVIVPANGTLPNIILSPRSVFRIKQALERERFDVLHLHEPMTPVICTAALAWARCPVVATHHASGGLGWLRAGQPAWGFLMDRIDRGLRMMFGSEPFAGTITERPIGITSGGGSPCRPTRGWSTRVNCPGGSLPMISRTSCPRSRSAAA